jgi:16S rRNA (guanine(966)-N(2))-methyltransferase RsmD
MPPPRKPLNDADEATSPPRIIGGSLRGRKLEFAPDPRTRPMKQRVREALFNLLGPEIEGKHAIDLFAGTGALGIEALSRGAASAIFVERHFPTADTLKRNLEGLDLDEVGTVLAANSMLWSKRLPELPAIPWVVFCSPPYDLYIQQEPEVMALVTALLDAAPVDSQFAVECDMRFDVKRLPLADQWDVREYPPAVLAVMTKK